MNLKGMSFKDLLDAEISSSFELKSPNTKKSHPWYLSHLHADFIELKCLFWAKNEWLSIKDIIGHYKDSGEEFEKEESLTDAVGSNASENEDKLFSKFIDIFEVIKERLSYFEDDYPFEVDSKNNYIKLKTKISDRHVLYIKLLLDSNLNNFPKLQHILTKDFEKISAWVLKEYLPNSQVSELGKNSTHKGNTKTKIESLSKDLNITIRKEEVDRLPPSASQEKGLDLIAYIPFKDKIASTIILLAQCACGKPWPNKTNETSNYESYLDFYKQRPIHSMFVPYCLSFENTGFYQSESLNDKLVFERKRIIEFISDFTEFHKLESFEIANKVFETEAVEV